MKVKCKKNFNYRGGQISLNDENEVQLFKKSFWIKDKIYDARYYEGGVMCPFPAYFIMSENNDEFLFTLIEAKPTYELFSEYFDLTDHQ